MLLAIKPSLTRLISFCICWSLQTVSWFGFVFTSLRLGVLVVIGLLRLEKTPALGANFAMIAWIQGSLPLYWCGHCFRAASVGPSEDTHCLRPHLVHTQAFPAFINLWDWCSPKLGREGSLYWHGC